jgi:lambda family phage portal protein
VLLPRIQRDPFRPLWLSLEVIEGHRVNTPDHGVEEARGLRIREGIELDRFNQPIAIWVEIIDEADQVFGDALPKSNWRRIALRDRAGRPLVLQVALSMRPGQSRGEPMFAPSLSAFRHLDAFVESELLAKRMEACFGAFIQQDLSLLDVDDPDGETDAEGYDVSRLEPAMVARLGPGESVQFADPKRPGGGFIDFVKIMLRGIAAGFGLSYEVVFSDYAGMNYSSARTAILDARRAFRVWQRFLDVQLCTPIWQLAIEEGVLREKLPLIGDWQSYAAELTEVRWIAPGWDWVDPLKEVNAHKISVQEGFSTATEVCAARGVDREEVAKQRKRELDFDKRIGLTRASTPTVVDAGNEKDEQEDEE